MSSAAPGGPVLACRDLYKIYKQGSVEVPVLMGVNLEVHLRLVSMTLIQ